VPGSLVGKRFREEALLEDPPTLSASPAVRHGRRISAYSLGWTVSAGSAAIAIGVVGNSLTLVVFGVIGLLDAVGSATLIYHFSRAITHQADSPRRERATLMVVSVGMAAVGVATIADSGFRLHTRATSDPLLPGIVLTGISVLVLGSLSARKRRIARRIPSQALHADGWLSAVGALLAGVALLGTTLNKAFDWWWIDPVAAIGVACSAVVMSVTLLRGTASKGGRVE